MVALLLAMVLLRSAIGKFGGQDAELWGRAGAVTRNEVTKTVGVGQYLFDCNPLECLWLIPTTVLDSVLRPSLRCRSAGRASVRRRCQ